jgi:Cu2+-exporting ATPase
MSNNNCFHCGLPVVEKGPPMIEFDGHQQIFCCHGCKAVCEAIITSRNADYYKHREKSARTFDSSGLPKLLDKLKLYDNEDIQREFVRVGANSEWKEAWLILEEIRCAACMWLNERTLRSLEGVLDVQMDYTGQQARVRWDPRKIRLSEILSAITTIGYHAHPFDPSQRESLNEEQKQRSLQRIIFAVILGMAVMQSAIGSYFLGDANAQGEFPLWIKISRWVNVFSTFLLLAYPGQLFFRNAWHDLKNTSLGMDVPVAIGLSVAWLGSLYSTIRGDGDVYFESIAMFVIFLLIARYIELQARISATALLDRSAKIIPQTAKLLRNTNNQQISTREVPVIELKKGDHIQVSPGDTIPVDGLLLSSRSSFDESLLTGESLPVSHERGEKILGGSINIEQVVDIEVLSGKADSTLNALCQLTRKSINSRPYYIDIAESVAGKFVAIILFIATATFFFWLWFGGVDGFSSALSHSVSVLIVTCPCALALAAPVALSLGAAGLNHYHVLAIRMSSIEGFSHVDTIVFDKTGTLTTGSPVVKNISLVCEGNQQVKDENVYLSIAALMEKGSQHPFARAILKLAEARGVSHQAVKIDSVKQFPGQGVEAVIKNVHNQESRKKTWRLGNEAFMSSGSIGKMSFSVKTNQEIKQWRNKGYSVLYLSDDSGVQAIFAIVDPLRQGIRSFIRQLDNLGIKRHVILSGDHQHSVTAIANQLGIHEAYGGLSPHDKLEWMRNAQQQQGHNKKIMMLGDGINDAPTLAMADISLTFSDATDLAQSNADLVVLGKDYTMLGKAFLLMRKTRRIILQNLGWAIAYNIIAVPAATVGWITPWMAAIGMSLSSLIVVFNSLRLKKV